MLHRRFLTCAAPRNPRHRSDGGLRRNEIGDKLNKPSNKFKPPEAGGGCCFPAYDRNPILFVRGEGVHIIDEQGERILTC